MPVGLLITPALDRCLVERRGIVTVPKEDATVSCWCAWGKACWGLLVDQLPLRANTLARHLKMMGTKFIERMAIRGYEWVGSDLRLHGPWVSYEFNQRLTNIESAAWQEAQNHNDPSLVAPFVFERDATSPYSDYLLIGRFLTKPVLTEVIVRER